MIGTLSRLTFLTDRSHGRFDVAVITAITLHILAFCILPEKIPRAYEPLPAETFYFFNPVFPVEEFQDKVGEVTPPEIPRVFESDLIPITEDPTVDEVIVDVDVKPRAFPTRQAPVLAGPSNEEWLIWEKGPELLRIIQPDYPSLARQAGIEGTVHARVYIDERGRVIRVEIIESTAVVFNESVREALLRSEFSPAETKGVFVQSSVIVPVHFTLH